ncbi:MAG: acyl carrier protein [Lachnospiraceae bacterium]|nr:acyl carrier protein [Lachnospiraceae bacterium]
MSKEEILKKINDILKDIFDDETLVISMETTAKDIDEWDSLNHITIISTIENEFDVDFTMEEVVNFKNVGDIVDKIVEKS